MILAIVSFLGTGVVEADGGNDGLREDFVSMGRQHLLQLDLSNVFVGVFPAGGRPPQRIDFPYVVAKGGGDDGGEQEIVPLPQFLTRNVEGGLQDVVGVVVEGDALEDFEEVLMLPQVPVLAIRHFARPADHRGGVAALIEQPEQLIEDLHRGDLSEEGPVGSDEGLVVFYPPFGVQRGRLIEDAGEGRLSNRRALTVLAVSARERFSE